MSPTPAALPPLPQPGLPVHNDYSFLAQAPTLLLLKDNPTWSTKSALTITHSGAPYLDAKEEGRRQMVFRTPQGQEVLRVVKEEHKWSGRGSEYNGMRPDGSAAWHVKLHHGLSGTDYSLYHYL